MRNDAKAVRQRGRIARLVLLLLVLLPGIAAAQSAAAPALPAQIPLFPLGELVLFPETTRPLVIFEPRYREMVAEALKGNRIIGMVLLRPGWEKDYEGRPPIYDVGCAGEIIASEQLPDGRYTILLKGFAKFRVLSEDQSRAYRLARISPVAESLPDTDLAPLSAARERLAGLLVRVLPAGVEPPPPALGDVEYVNLLAQYLPFDEEARQELLERGGPLSRARAMIEFIERLP